MYIPKEFIESDIERIISIANTYAFGMIVTVKEGIPFANHIPLMIDGNEPITIYGHMAISNEQWRHFNENTDVLVIYQGPHAYISPSYYENKGVPTWNYSAVHMYGKASVISDKQRTAKLIEDLSHKYEKGKDNPWQPNYSPAALNGIVGFEIEVERIEAKSKLSQNKPEGDRKKIITSLRNCAGEAESAVAQLMEKNEL